VIGFALFYFTGGNEFAGLLRILDLPMYDLREWHLLVAVVLGILGAALAVTFGLSMKVLKRLAMPLNRLPILRNTLAGLLLGTLGFALPLTLFLGSDGLVFVTENAAELGIGLLLVYVFAKILATAGAISTGFIGGPIFPLFFVGGTLGTVVTLLFPDIPIALAVGCLMVAVTAGILPIPISLGVYVILIVGLPIIEAIPVLIAALTSFLVIKGFGLLSPAKKPAAKKSDESG
jgi:H+/Cl- antiporter ClcA